MSSQNIPILVVDDDPKLCRLLAEYLAPFGYAVEVAHDGAEGLRRAQQGRFAAVILDVMMPVMDGTEMLRQLRQTSDVPVLMLTARAEETDRIVGLELGADDYLPKTFSHRELLARLRAVTRRSRQRPAARPSIPELPLILGELAIDLAAHEVSLAGEPLELTPVEYEILSCLARATGRVQSRDRLLQKVAGRDYESFDRSVDVHISSLRRKLGDDPKRPRFIKTVRSAGYMFLKQGD
ncbi:MAG: response regulator transcription factor [Myxococcales bacterium]|nr:response regulator transcription factor [Myxococcales bacterium]